MSLYNFPDIRSFYVCLLILRMSFYSWLIEVISL